MLTDKRIIKTKTAIKNAFMQLITERDIGRITISDVAERANINRSTFYLHYSDTASIMSDIEREIAARISTCLDNFDIRDIYESTYKMFTSLTDKLDEMENIKKYILYSTNSSYVTKRIKEIFIEKTCDAILEYLPRLTKDKILYPVTFAAGGIIDSYIKWCLSEPKQISLEELIKTVSEYAKNIIELIKRV